MVGIVLTAVTVLGAAGASTGCTTCDEATKTLSAAISKKELLLNADGSLVVRGRPFKSCTEFCNDSENFLSLERCETTSANESQYRLDCTGVVAVCQDPTHVDFR
jgi:hypothetical protein